MKEELMQMHSDTTNSGDIMSITYDTEEEEETEKSSFHSGMLVSGQRTPKSIHSENLEPHIPLPSCLQSNVSHFQTEVYSKMIKNNGRRLSRLFQMKKSSSIIDMTESKAEVQLNHMMRHQSEKIPTALLKNSMEYNHKAIKLFSDILRYTGENGHEPSLSETLQIIEKILERGLKTIIMTDELYAQLIKQTRNLTNEKLNMMLWKLFGLVAATMPPSRLFLPMICEYIHDVCRQKSTSLEILNLAKNTFHNLRKSVKSGNRQSVPTLEEINSFMTGQLLKTILFFMDGTYEEVSYTLNTTVLDAVEQISSLVKLENHKGFTFYEHKKNKNKEDDYDYIILGDELYLSDIISNFEKKRSEDSQYTSRIVIRKKLFRGDDENIISDTFVNLNYIQIQHDYIEGKYPVDNDFAVKLCALQLVAEFGSRASKINRNILISCLNRFTRKNLKTKYKEIFFERVMQEFDSIKDDVYDSARLKFIELIRNLPYGLCTFYNVKRVEDPIGLLPSKLILGLNKNGIHFFQPVPRLFLYSVELRDLKQFGSNKSAIFFKMRLANTMSTFQFETSNGEEICQVIQTYINDVLMKRVDKTISETKESEEEVEELAMVDYGETYEFHIEELKKKIDLAELKYHENSKIISKLEYEKDQKEKEFEEIKTIAIREENGKIEEISIIDNLSKYNQQRRDELVNIEAKLMMMKNEGICALNIDRKERSRFQSMEFVYQDKTRVVGNYGSSLKELEFLIEKSAKEKEEISIRLVEFDKVKEAEKQGLLEEISAINANFKAILKEKEDKVNKLMEELADVTMMKNDYEAELANLKSGQSEIEYLRQVKVEIDQREKMFACLIQDHNTKIKHFEERYKNEQVTRKKLYNVIEDMKGKIRVCARIRPLQTSGNGTKSPILTSMSTMRIVSNLEPCSRQLIQNNNVLRMPDELTIVHDWKREEIKEYIFDKVYDQEVTQAEVFRDTKDLIQSAIDGYNVCIFAYGQTGSGKTHTIYGTKNNPGLTLRGILHLFECLNKENFKYSYNVSCYMLELYQDTLNDLLCQNVEANTFKEKLEIKRDADQMIWVQGATIFEVDSAEELLKIFEEGAQRRHVASTRMNTESSRSHLIMGIVIQCTNIHTQVTTKGKLSFVDLAGSERVKKSGSTGINLKEAQAINKSLSALGDVVSALSRGDPHVPYRNHKLTMLMSDSLGGNAKTLMFVNVSPAEQDLEETQNSLSYAMRVKTIQNDTFSKKALKEATILKKDIQYWKTIEKSKVNELISEYV